MPSQPAKSPDAPPAPLVEGVDYTVEAGRWMFTAAFHLKRGHCCESGCRHCPYGFTRSGVEQPEPPSRQPQGRP